jgi:hypothetical protein
MVRGYRRFSPVDEDEIWRRMRAGHSMKPAARALGLPTSTVRSYLVRCGGIRPAARRRGPGRLSFGRAGGDLPWSGRGSVVADDRGGSGSFALDDQPGGRRTRWSGWVSGSSCRPAGVVAGQASPGVQAGNPSPVACDRGREAPAGAVVTSADRRLAEDHLSRRGGDAGVARDDLLHPVHPVPRRLTQGTDRSPAHRPGDPTTGGDLATGRTWWPTGHPQHLRTPAPLKPSTERCPGAGKATWSSANACHRWRRWWSAPPGS